MAQSYSIKSLEKITRLLTGATIFLAPLFFLPFTPEPLELPKQYVLAALVLLNILAWLGHAVVSRTVEFRRTPFDVPLIVFWVIALLSTLISHDRLTSLIGNYDNYSWSFLSLTLLLLVFFLLTQQVRRYEDAERFMKILVASGMVAQSYFILKGLLPWVVSWIPIAASNSVSVLASALGLFSLVTFIVCSSGLLRRHERFTRTDWFWAVGTLLSLATLVLIGFRNIWMLTAIAVALSLIYAVARIDDHRFSLVIGMFVLFVVSILFAFFGVPRWLSLRLPLEVSLSQDVSWQVATSAVTSNVKSFLLGGGPATFVFDFSKYRPESFNSNFAWNVRFGQPSSTMIELFAALGVLGMVAFIAIILLAFGSVLVTWFRKVGAGGVLARMAQDGASRDHLPWFWAVASAWLTLLIAAFFLTFNSVLWLVFFFFLALLAALATLVLKDTESVHRYSLKTSPQYTLLVSFGFIIACAAILVFGIFLTRFLAGEVAYASGLRSVVANQPEAAISNFSRAISYHPRRPVYHISLAQSYLLQGLKIVGSGQSDPNLITTLVALAVNEAKRATELSPANVAGWQSLATMYANARPIAPDANIWVVRSLERAIELEGTNPILHVQLGNAQFVARQFDVAIKEYQRAVQLKPDYIDAYLNLALLEEGMGKVDDSLNHLSQALLIQPQNTDILWNLGRIYYNRNQSGDLVRAKAAFELTVGANSNHANALFSLGLIAEREGQTSKALEYYRRVAQLNPDNQDVKRKIQALTGSTP